MKFKVSSKSFTKFLKVHKLDKTLYLTIRPSGILLRNIDFKQCVGVVESEYYCDNHDIQEFSFKVQYVDLINKLDNFKNQVYFIIDSLQSILKLVDPENETYEFKISCQVGKHVDTYAKLILIPSWEPTNVKFQLDYQEALNCFKMITAVQHIIHFRFFKPDSEYPVQLISKKISNLGVKKINKKDLGGYQYIEQAECVEFQVYFSPHFYNILKEADQSVKFSSYIDYFVLQSNLKDPLIRFKVYIPKKPL